MRFSKIVAGSAAVQQCRLVGQSTPEAEKLHYRLKGASAFRPRMALGRSLY
jgi:hypothetical protein